MQTPAGKIALVTGGSKGIGRATCLRLARDGAKVAINYSNNSSAADEVLSLIGEENATAIKADAGNVEEISKLVDATVEKYGKIDILVACAAIMKLNELENVTEAELDQTFNLNVKGPFFLAQKSPPHMAPGSCIILFSTTQCHASTVIPNYLTYIMSKGAIEQMTRGLSKDLAQKSIIVNTVAPGPTSTELFPAGKSEQRLKMIAGLVLRMGLDNPRRLQMLWRFWVVVQVHG